MKKSNMERCGLISNISGLVKQAVANNPHPHGEVSNLAAVISQRAPDHCCVVAEYVASSLTATNTELKLFDILFHYSTIAKGG